MGSNGEKPISQEDSLSKEHEKMINDALSRLNEVSDQINERDNEYMYAFSKFNNFATFVEADLEEKALEYGLHHIRRSKAHQENSNYLKDLLEVSKKISLVLSNYYDKRGESMKELSALEKTISAKNTNEEDYKPSEAEMFRMNDLIAQINYFTENEKTLKKYYQKVLKAVEVTKQFCDAQKTLYQRSIKIAQPFYEYRKSLMEALSDQNKNLEKLDSERMMLKKEYRDSMLRIRNISSTIKEDIAQEAVNAASEASSNVESSDQASLNSGEMKEYIKNLSKAPESPGQKDAANLLQQANKNFISNSKNLQNSAINSDDELDPPLRTEEIKKVLSEEPARENLSEEPARENLSDDHSKDANLEAHPGLDQLS